MLNITKRANRIVWNDASPSVLFLPHNFSVRPVCAVCRCHTLHVHSSCLLFVGVKKKWKKKYYISHLVHLFSNSFVCTRNRAVGFNIGLWACGVRVLSISYLQSTCFLHYVFVYQTRSDLVAWSASSAGVPPSPPDRILRMQIDEARMSYRQRRKEEQRACHILSLHKYLRRAEWIRKISQKCIAIRKGGSRFVDDTFFLGVDWCVAHTSVSWCISNLLRRWRHGSDMNGKCRYTNWKAIKFDTLQIDEQVIVSIRNLTQSDIVFCPALNCVETNHKVDALETNDLFRISGAHTPPTTTHDEFIHFNQFRFYYSIVCTCIATSHQDVLRNRNSLPVTQSSMTRCQS